MLCLRKIEPTVHDKSKSYCCYLTNRIADFHSYGDAKE
jgi:hypothetical protein